MQSAKKKRKKTEQVQLFLPAAHSALGMWVQADCTATGINAYLASLSHAVLEKSFHQNNHGVFPPFEEPLDAI